MLLMFQELIEDFQKFSEMVQKTLDLEAAPKEYLIRPDFDTTLSQLHAQKERIKERLNAHAEEVV